MNEFECSDKLEKLNRKIEEINYKKKNCAIHLSNIMKTMKFCGYFQRF